MPDVIPLRRDQGAAIRRFIAGVYGPAYYGIERRYFEWLFEHAPCRWFADSASRGAFPGNVVLEAGEIAALHLYLPFDLRSPWGGTVGIWDIEWITASATRGLGRALAQHLRAAVDLYAGYGCNDLSARSFERLGMTVVPAIERRVAVLDAERLDRMLEAHGLPMAPVVRRRPARRARSIERPAILEDTAAIGRSAIDGHAAAVPFGVTRDPAWLGWRYDRHPHLDYAVVAPDANGSGGAAVLRLEEVPGTSCRVARVLDVLAEPGREGPVVGAALGFAAARDALLLDYFSTDRATADRIAADPDAAFLANPEIPYMFQPPAVGAAHAMNLVIAAGGRAPAEAVDLAAFHATKADANQDVLRSAGTAARLGKRQQKPTRT